MIEYLTDSQLSKIPEFINRWTEIGLSTEQVSDADTLKIAREITTLLIGYKENVPIIVMDSPKSCWEVVEKLNKRFDHRQLLCQIGSETYDRMAIHLGSNSVWQLVSHFLSTSMVDQLHAIERKIREIVEPIRITISREVCAPYILGHWMAPRLAWYAYLPEILGIWQYPGLWPTFMKIQHIGFLYACGDFCVVGKKPIELNYNAHGLHKDGGPAISYADGKKTWALNGVHVPQWLVKTPAMEIDCAKFAEIKNTEVRREFVRKVGIERLVTKLGAKTLDKQGDYEVILVNLGGRTGEWPYLKMLNPSIGVWHLECLEHECKTVQAAINFRASRLKSLKSNWNPSILT